MSERDDELLRRYRALSPEAPSASVDAAILAASRRSVRSRPLARWALPVSVAAVMVLAVGVVLQIQREAPDAGMPVESRAAPAAAAGTATAESATAEPAGAPPLTPPAASAAREHAAAPRPLEKPRTLSKMEAKRAAPRDAGASSPEAPAAKIAPPTPAPMAAPSAPPVPSPAPPPALDAAARANAAAPAEAAPAARAAQSAAAPQRAQRALAEDPLTRELERIARLRAEGKDDEADAALVAFRREHPDYRIEPAMWDRVRRR